MTPAPADGPATAAAPLSGLLSLRDRVAVVTGGGGGIGRAVCTRLAEAGARVVSWDLPGAASGPGVDSVPCDLADAESIHAAFARLDEQHERLDALVHCAGVTRDAVLWKMTAEDWNSVLSVNLDSAFRVLHDGIPRLRAAGGGSIVLVSSINGERGKFGQANYAASKAGLIGLARTAAREVGAFGIRVNVVSPGMIATGMTEELPSEVRRRAVGESALGRLGQPDDVARVVLFLLADASCHMTGQVLRVDGGQLIG
ncbi:MAG: 3-oxoacyl-ACP reductase [Gemmatimonadota bacterium]|nr:MAG: 3-oxoacyl-ACP reductase [Gemmatimonadota bacterium]